MKGKILPPDEWKNDLNMLTRLYLSHTEIKVFENGRMNPCYFKIKSFFSRQKEIKSVYTFLYQTDKTFNNLTEMYIARDKWWEEQKYKSKEEIRSYKSIGLEEIMNL